VAVFPDPQGPANAGHAALPEILAVEIDVTSHSSMASYYSHFHSNKMFMRHVFIH